MPGRAKQVCYLQDLFVDAKLRGTGCGRALIERVAEVARERDCLRLYWTTKEDNATARLLYDRLAKFNGFIRYDYALELTTRPSRRMSAVAVRRAGILRSKPMASVPRG